MRYPLFTLLLCGWLPVLAQDADTGLQSPMELVQQARSEIKEISIEELAARPAPSILIDVREPYEYEEGRIPGARNIPRGRLEFDLMKHPELELIGKVDPPSLAATEIVLYCRSGGRGALAAQSLQSMGFTNVKSIAGGYQAWVEAGEPVQQNPAE